jgi:hypothetical protein
MITIQRQPNALVIVASIFAVVLVLIHFSANAVAVNDDGSTLVGTWAGESLCVGNRPACHDEKVIYRITKAPDDAGNVTITTDKIVNGKPETMGVLDFKYDGGKHTLTCDFTRGQTHGVWELTVKEDTMEGTLIVLPDKTLARRVRLKKEVSSAPGSTNSR